MLAFGILNQSTRTAFSLPLLLNLSSSLAVLSGQASAADAPGTELQLHKDREYGDSFLVPSGWAASENELSGGRKLVAFADPGDSDSNIFILWTPLAPRGVQHNSAQSWPKTQT